MKRTSDGKPRYRGQSKRGRGTKKTPVFVAVERKGNIRRRIVADVTAKRLKMQSGKKLTASARILTDEFQL